MENIISKITTKRRNFAKEVTIFFLTKKKER